jgi:hypothetical protein
MRKIKKACIIFILSLFSLFILFGQTAGASTSKGTAPAASSPVNTPEKKDNSFMEKNKLINDKFEDIKIYKDRNNNENLNSSGSLKILEKVNLNNFSIKLDDLQALTNNIKKNIKILNNNENYQIKDEYNNIKKEIDKLDIDNGNFLAKIDKEDKQLIVEQNSSIKKSISNLQKLLNNLNKDFDKVNSNEELYNKTIDMEKEIKNINRQYRAIEWILFEQ